MRRLGFESSIWNYCADACGRAGCSVRRHFEHAFTGGAVVRTASHAATSAAPTTSTASAPASAPASVAVVATIPSDQLLFSGKLIICSDLPYPPQEYFDADGNPIGSDIEIGEGIAARLGLTGRS